MSIGLMAVLFFAGIVLFFFLLGKFTWGSGADVLDWDPTQRQEARRANEDEDMEQLLERLNEERRAQGRPLLTHDNVLDTLGREHE